MEITKHAFERAKQRLGWTKKTLYRMSYKIEESGKRVGDLPKEFQKYIRNVLANGEEETDAIVHGEAIFIISSGHLVTIYKLPKNLRRRVTEQP